MKLSYIASFLLAAVSLTSCSLDSEVFDYKDGETAYRSMQDITNALHGSYHQLGSRYFLGYDAIALADMCSGVSISSPSSGHFLAYCNFTFSENDMEIQEVWGQGYSVIAESTNAINAAKKLDEQGVILESQKEDYHSTLAQLYALKTLSNYYLVGFFALPYSEANRQKPGIILITDTPSAPFAPVTRATVEQVYEAMKADIASAEKEYELAGNTTLNDPFYLSQAALQALKARVYLAMGDYSTAKNAALLALQLQGNGDGTPNDYIPSNDDYINAWGNVAANAEDIFTIKKSDEDNLSAFSLSTLFSTYNAGVENWVVNLIADTDIRRNVLRNRNSEPGLTYRKYDGQTAPAAANIPILRKSEMTLIVAECEARQGHIADAQNYLFFSAKRDTDITSPADLPSDSKRLLDFIVEERIREFMGEAHHFFDARRMGLIVTNDNFTGWDISKFSLPIPDAEISSGFGCQQNVDWSDFLPKR